MSMDRPSGAEKSMMIVEIDIASNRPGNSCQRVLVSDLNLRVFIAVRKWRMWSRSVITDAMLVTSRVVGDSIEGAPKSNSRLAKKT